MGSVQFAPLGPDRRRLAGKAVSNGKLFVVCSRILDTHAGWRTRGYLPHYNAAEQIQHVIFRLADSLPAKVEAHIARLPAVDRGREAEGWLDVSYGDAVLHRLEAAKIARDTLLHDHGIGYRLLAWCVMPTHVHVLLQQAPGRPLATVVQAWKSVSAHQINRVLGRSGRLWAREYFDRAMTREGQTDACGRYILNNPVKARLCATAEAWPWSGGVEG